MNKFKVGDKVIIKGTSRPEFYGNPTWGTVFELNPGGYWIGEYGSEKNYFQLEETIELKELWGTPLYKAMNELD